jgi:hypothetical protein
MGGREEKWGWVGYTSSSASLGSVQGACRCDIEMTESEGVVGARDNPLLSMDSIFLHAR